MVGKNFVTRRTPERCVANGGRCEKTAKYLVRISRFMWHTFCEDHIERYIREGIVRELYNIVYAYNENEAKEVIR